MIQSATAAPEPQTPMMPPVGLKALVLSSTAIVLTWSDASLGRLQRVTDTRYYTVRYNPKVQRKYKLVNATDFSLHAEDLKPDTEYEFCVKVTKGARQSTWSLSTFNRTKEAGRATTSMRCFHCTLYGTSLLTLTLLFVFYLY